MLLRGVAVGLFCLSIGFSSSKFDSVEESPFDLMEEVYFTANWDGSFHIRGIARQEGFFVISGNFEGELDLGPMLLNTEFDVAAFYIVYDEAGILRQAVILESDVSTEVLGLVGTKDRFGLVVEVDGQMAFLPMALGTGFHVQKTTIKLNSSAPGFLTIRKLVPDTLMFDFIESQPPIGNISDTTGSSGNPNPTGGTTGTGGGNGNGGGDGSTGS